MIGALVVKVVEIDEAMLSMMNFIYRLICDMSRE
jgi:hypothetical protein